MRILVLFWVVSLVRLCHSLKLTSPLKKVGISFDLESPDINKVFASISRDAGLDVVKHLPKPHVQITKVIRGGSTVWTARQGESCTAITVPSLYSDTHVSLMCSLGNLVYTRRYRRAHTGWKQVSEGDFVKSVNDLSKKLKFVPQMLDISLIDPKKTEVYEDAADGVLHKSYFPKHGNFNRVSDGQNVVWYGDQKDVCTAVYSGTKDGVLLVTIHLSEQGGTELKHYMRRENEWFSVPHGDFNQENMIRAKYF
ncbi:signal peptide-containing protein [Theileria equi strain WA]|uniref:Signal peptide-containing protein n=1 Tax=Theileria equi strain WA TaxID=1537102 RepID=L0AY95_THEEQ|nr:signal peptide-containing protein [Theileria equi strain WA]AFZ79976.1 signal peptide-containing protein [Theileria equi strain WA]|eukprot:XP_004829642.1 signal peptide-containing protein [Theileria equi strain WA]